MHTLERFTNRPGGGLCEDVRDEVLEHAHASHRRPALSQAGVLCVVKLREADLLSDAEAAALTKAMMAEMWNGSAFCDGVCADVNFDPHNCGACGNVCGAAETCPAGPCERNDVCPQNPSRSAAVDGASGAKAMARRRSTATGN